MKLTHIEIALLKRLERAGHSGVTVCEGSTLDDTMQMLANAGYASVSGGLGDGRRYFILERGARLLRDMGNMGICIAELEPADRFNRIRQWAHDRNLVEGSTPEKQYVKLMEELGELAHGMSKSRLSEIKDGIGDAVVVLTILAAQHGMAIEDCIDAAWEEIKDRKGRMVNGVFVKEEDL